MTTGTDSSIRIVVLAAVAITYAAMLYEGSAFAQPSDCDQDRQSQDFFTDGTNRLQFSYSRRYESITFVAQDNVPDVMSEEHMEVLRREIEQDRRLGTIIRGPSSGEFQTVLVRVAPGACSEDIAPVLIGNAVAGSDEQRHTGNPIYDAGDVDHMLVNRVIVQFAKDATPAQIDALIGAHKTKEESRRQRAGRWRYILSVPGGTARDALSLANKLNRNEQIVDFAQPDFIVIASDRVQSGMTSLSAPECIAPIEGPGPDPYFPEQWYLDHSTPGLTGDSNAHISAKDAWEVTEGDNRIVVAVLDDAVEISHPDLAGKIHSTWNAFTGNTDLEITDQDKHGTPVAGIIGAMTGNAHGVKATAPTVKLMPVRVIQWVETVDGNNNPVWDSEYPISVVSDGIEAAAEEAHILNVSLSLGIFKSWYHLDVQAAADVALSKDRVLVFAAGNDGLDYVVFPARMSATRPVIAIGATDESDTIKTNTGGSDWGSNYGPEISVVAPGVNIVAPDRSGANGYCADDYTRYGGTSAATPIVAGVAALMQSQYMSQEATLLTPEALRTRLSETAIDLGPIGRDDHYGDGRVDACAALQEDTCNSSTESSWCWVIIAVAIVFLASVAAVYFAKRPGPHWPSQRAASPTGLA